MSPNSLEAGWIDPPSPWPSPSEPSDPSAEWNKTNDWLEINHAAREAMRTLVAAWRFEQSSLVRLRVWPIPADAEINQARTGAMIANRVIAAALADLSALVDRLSTDHDETELDADIDEMIADYAKTAEEEANRVHTSGTV